MKTISSLWELGEGDVQVQMEPVRRVCSCGLDVFPNTDRCVAWQLLSSIITPDPKQWKPTQDQYLADYLSFVEAFKLGDYLEKAFDANATDFGLDDNSLMTIIHGDLTRSVHHIIFFPSPDPSIKAEKEDHLTPFSMHIRRIERILYIFGKFNRALGYMQGFNELICPLYFVFASAVEIFDGDWNKMEAVTYFTFQQFFCATQLNDLYTTTDNSSFIKNQMNQFSIVLKKHNPEASKIIDDLGIDPLCFALRWMNLLFAQDYQMPDLVRIWDSLFAHYQNLIEYDIYIAIAQINMLDSHLSVDDFAETMALLQKKHPFDVTQLISIADRYWQQDHPRSANE